VSNSEANGGHPDRAAFRRLEGIVGAALARMEELSERAAAAEATTSEMEELVRRFTADADEPARMLSRLEALERENGDMKARLRRGREGVERLLARIRFLEENQ
jgi:septal ring factor EnvC (AmiA/AmiB activator)